MRNEDPEVRDCRTLDSSDIPRLVVLFENLLAAGAEKHFHPHPLTAEAARRVIESRSADLYFVVLRNQTFIGYGMLRGWDEGFEVPSLGIAVHGEERGNGVARMFMEFLHDTASARGARRVRLKVNCDNVPAIRLYRACGYTFADETASEWVGYKSLGSQP